VAIDPEFSKNGYVYLFSSSKGSNRTYGGYNNIVMRMKVNSSLNAVSDVVEIINDLGYKPLKSNHPFGGPGAHNGGRLRFGPDGFLYATIGDNHNGPGPQSPTEMRGKLLRVDRDGKAAPGNNPPAGFALGHATGDGNAWIHWLLWSHGSYLVDDKEKIIINSPETVKALEYAKKLTETFIPGTASWNDSSNNKAFLAGDLHLTSNGISIYVGAKADKALNPIAEDMDHAKFPVGPIGKPQELQLTFPMLAFKYTKAPNAAKAFMAFVLEAENYNPWLEAAGGYLTHPLMAYDSNPIWTKDPKNAVFKDAARNTLPASGIGPVNEKAAAAIADFVLLDMVANYCTGREDIKGAIAIAERQAKRIYR
jgi:ABC-type glycerol-3-phosphate transport system substrate-binding protein